ncbi:vesicle transport protein USE1-like [Symsagittifera roscoffensis]|uniref:vesicle transport protein USE1-like n=1 Tax=Symsagittifera roscoffensis TaxID=84072 RepID=UPI00307B7F03
MAIKVIEEAAPVKHFKSPLEINLIRLLHRCEQRALNESPEVATDWRQHKYIACLKDFLNKLQNGNPVEKPSTEDLSDYKQRIGLLETNLQTMKNSLDNGNNCEAEHIDNKYLKQDDMLDSLNQTISETASQKTQNITNSDSDHKEFAKTDQISSSKQHDISVGGANAKIVNGSSTSGHVQLQAKTSAQPLKDMRNELLRSNNAAVRLRNKTGLAEEAEDSATNESVEAILNRHQAVQEKIADDMLKLARSLKQTSLTANEIIKKDQENLNRANDVAASNYDKLQTETIRVSNTKPLGCQWWLVLPLGLVCLVFMWVVFLIKIT